MFQRFFILLKVRCARHKPHLIRFQTMSLRVKACLASMLFGTAYFWSELPIIRDLLQPHVIACNGLEFNSFTIRFWHDHTQRKAPSEVWENYLLVTWPPFLESWRNPPTASHSSARDGPSSVSTMYFRSFSFLFHHIRFLLLRQVRSHLWIPAAIAAKAFSWDFTGKLHRCFSLISYSLAISFAVNPMLRFNKKDDLLRIFQFNCRLVAHHWHP